MWGTATGSLKKNFREKLNSVEKHPFLWIKMDTLRNIFKGKKEKESSRSKGGETSQFEDIPVIEVSETRETKRVGEIEPILIKSIDLNSVVDVQEVSNELQDGNIVILNISPLMDEDPAELKRAVDQLKGITREMGGDVGRLSESRIIATPELVRIQFRKEG